MCCIGFAPNVTLCIQDKTFLKRSFAASDLMQTDAFDSVQASFFSLC
jgi:hypothetical protein